MMDRDTVTGRNGARVDITEQINQLLCISDSGEFQAKYKVDFIKSFGWRLISAADIGAPATVIDDYADDMTPEFVAFLRITWRAIASGHG